ncbi:hypothetical protein Tco_0606707 [Tanacetum coccineum]
MPSKAQQSALDNVLVAPENQRVIGKCNMRINPGMKPKESTYQVVLDALALTTCYHAFLITTEVPTIYMHQLWATVDKHKASYRFKINNKRFSMNVEVFRDILNICPRILVMTNQAMLDYVAYKTYYAIALGAEPPKIKKPKTKYDSAISFEETPSKKKPTKAKKDVPSKKNPNSKPKPTKKKAPVEADKGKGLNVLSEIALFEATQLKEATKRSKKDFHISQESGSDSDDDERNEDNSDEVTKDDDEDDVESDANDDKEASDSEKTESNEDENLNLNLNDDDEEEKEEDDVQHEEVGKGDAEMTNTTHEGTSQEKSYEQVIKDAHVTLTSSLLTEGSKQSSSVSSDFASKFLNLDNVPPVIDEVASMMNVKTPHEESSTQAPPLLTVPVTAIPEISTVAATTLPSIVQPFSSIPQMTTPTLVPTTEPTTSSILDLLDFASLFGFDQRVSALEQDLSQVKQSYTAEFEKKAQAEKEKYIDIIKKSVKEIIKDEVKSKLPQILPKEISDFATPVIQSTINKSLKNVVLAKSSSQPQYTCEAATSLNEFELKKILLDKLEKSHEDKDKDEDPSAGSDQGLKKKKTSKDAKPSSGKSAQAEKPIFETADTEMPQDQGDDMRNTDDQPNVEEASKHD